MNKALRFACLGCYSGLGYSFWSNSSISWHCPLFLLYYNVKLICNLHFNQNCMKLGRLIIYILSRMSAETVLPCSCSFIFWSWLTKKVQRKVVLIKKNKVFEVQKVLPYWFIRWMSALMDWARNSGDAAIFKDAYSLLE